MTDDEWYDRHRLDEIKLTEPEHGWLKTVAEVSVAGAPRRDSSDAEIPLLFESESGGRFTELSPAEQWVLAAYHTKKYYDYYFNCEACPWPGDDAHRETYHYASLCRLRGLLGEEFEPRLGGLIRRLDESTHKQIDEALEEEKKANAARRRAAALESSRKVAGNESCVQGQDESCRGIVSC